MEQIIKRRFFDVAVKIYNSLNVVKYPHPAADVKRQLLRSSTSAAANYRAACRAKSASDFLNKLKIVEEETDETMFWLEFLSEIRINIEGYSEITKELNELISIIVASIKTTRNRINRKLN